MKNFLRAILDQGPFLRFIRNFILSRKGWGLFHHNSHISQRSVKPKVKYNTKKTAEKAANSMSKKYGGHYSNYKCIFCDGYHIGGNRRSNYERSSISQTPRETRESESYETLIRKVELGSTTRKR